MAENKFLELMSRRRSVRTYSGEAIPDEILDQIVEAGLLAPSAKNLRSYEFILVRDKEILKELVKSRAVGAAMLDGADAAVITFGDSAKSPIWIEDCCIAMSYMQLMAESLGVGNCWVQGRLRESSDGRSTEVFIRDLLGVPDNMMLEGILSLGMPENHPEAREIPSARDEKIHRDKF